MESIQKAEVVLCRIQKFLSKGQTSSASELATVRILIFLISCTKMAEEYYSLFPAKNRSTLSSMSQILEQYELTQLAKDVMCLNEGL